VRFDAQLFNHSSAGKVAFIEGCLDNGALRWRFNGVPGKGDTRKG
jgi:hypothetical protein